MLSWFKLDMEQTDIALNQEFISKLIIQYFDS